jgi:ATP-dependent Lon protease
LERIWKGKVMNSSEANSKSKALIVIERDKLPKRLPILPVRGQVVFPTLHTSLAIKSDSTALLESVLKGDRVMGVVGVPDSTSNFPLSKQAYRMGTVVRITYVTRASEDTTVIVAEGLHRFRVI